MPLEIFDIIKIQMQRVILSKAYFSVSLPSFDYAPPPYQGLSYDQVKQDRLKYVPHFNPHNYKEPLLIIEGKKQYLFDHKGKRYQDWISGISTVAIGHSHPDLIAAIQKQNQKLGHVSQSMLSNVQAQYAKMLCEKLGPQFDSVYLCNSGGEANDFAINLAKLYTKSKFFLSLRNGYHGLVGSAGSVTNLPNWVSPIMRSPGHEKLSWPSKYRGVHQSLDGLRRNASEVITKSTNGKVAGIIFESIQGIGGIVQYADGYHKMITEMVRNHGGLIISDEVQTGFGRLGPKFWGFKQYDFKPDIVTMAKGIANGLPLAAVVTRREIAQSINFAFFNTTGGGNVQCAAGIETLKIIQREKLGENSEKVGKYLLQELSRLKSKHASIGENRGRGLMIGTQMVKNRQTRQPNAPLAIEIMEKLKDRQILVGRGGGFGNVLRLQPSMCMSIDDAKYFIHHLDEVLEESK